LSTFSPLNWIRPPIFDHDWDIKFYFQLQQTFSFPLSPLFHEISSDEPNYPHSDFYCNDNVIEMNFGAYSQSFKIKSQIIENVSPTLVPRKEFNIKY